MIKKGFIYQRLFEQVARIIATLLLMVFASTAIAQDTVWVETTFQKQARLEFEHKQSDYEESAASLKDAIHTVRVARVSQYHETSLSKIIDGIEESEIRITQKDKDNYLFQLNDRLNKLKILYEKNRQFLELCELDRKSGGFYVIDKNLSEIKKNLTAEQVDSMMLAKNSTLIGQYYDWQDWLFLTLSHRQP